MKVSKQTIYLLWSGAIILCVGLSLFALIFAAASKPKQMRAFSLSSDTETTPEATNALSGTLPVTQPPQISAVRLRQTADAGREYLDKLIFLGDSTTYGIGAYYNLGYTELVPPSQIWTPANGTLTLSYYDIATIVYPETREEITIAEAARRAQPEYLVITLGVNGIKFMDQDWFMEAYTDLVHKILEASPDTKVILNSMYPVAASYPYQEDINNEKIRTGNGWIEQIAVDTDCKFLYSYEAVVGPDGNLPEGSQNGDGIHLTGETFTTVMQYIRTHAYLPDEQPITGLGDSE